MNTLSLPILAVFGAGICVVVSFIIACLRSRSLAGLLLMVIALSMTLYALFSLMLYNAPTLSRAIGMQRGKFCSLAVFGAALCWHTILIFDIKPAATHYIFSSFTIVVFFLTIFIPGNSVLRGEGFSLRTIDCLDRSVTFYEAGYGIFIYMLVAAVMVNIGMVMVMLLAGKEKKRLRGILFSGICLIAAAIIFDFVINFNAATFLYTVEYSFFIFMVFLLSEGNPEK